MRAELKDGEVRGMTLLYDQATETIMDPVAVVMSSAFTPFPGVTGAVAQLGAPPKRKVEYGTGIVVSASGHIIADRQVTDGCNVIVVGGSAMPMSVTSGVFAASPLSATGTRSGAP